MKRYRIYLDPECREYPVEVGRWTRIFDLLLDRLGWKKLDKIITDPEYIPDPVALLNVYDFIITFDVDGIYTYVHDVRGETILQIEDYEIKGEYRKHV